MVSAMNLAILTDLHGDRLLRYRLSAAKVRPSPALLHGHIDGIDDHSIAAIDRIVGERNIGQVFLDGSNLGGLARAIRRRRPGVRIITFCHNVETSFFFGALRSHRTPKAAAVLLANALAERAAVRSSDILFCLSERDGRIMRRLHGRMPDAVLPLAIADSYRPEEKTSADIPKERYALFVGGGFISFEFAHIAARAGSPPVILDRGPRPLKAFDPDLVELLIRRGTDAGIELWRSTTITAIEKSEDSYRVSVDRSGQPETAEFDLVVHGAGRIPELAGLDLDAAPLPRRRAQQPVVLIEHRRERLAVLLPQRGRAFDIGENQRDDAGGEIRHCGYYLTTEGTEAGRQLRLF